MQWMIQTPVRVTQKCNTWSLDLWFIESLGIISFWLLQKCSALLIFCVSLEECGLSLWMREKIFSFHVLYLSWTESAQTQHVRISACGVALHLLAHTYTCSSHSRLWISPKYLLQHHPSQRDQWELRMSEKRRNIKVPTWLLFKYPTVADNDFWSPGKKKKRSAEWHRAGRS